MPLLLMRVGRAEESFPITLGVFNNLPILAIGEFLGSSSWGYFPALGVERWLKSHLLELGEILC